MSGARQTSQTRFQDAHTEQAMIALEASLAAVHPVLHEAELLAADLGLPVAPLYLASARGSLRYVSACIIHHASRPSSLVVREEECLGMGVALDGISDRPGIAVLHGSTGCLQNLAEAERAPSRPSLDLGVHLAESPEARAFCGGPVGSTLMFAALAHHRWIHPRTRTKWSSDVSGARTIVSVLNGGGAFALPTTGSLVGLVHIEVVDLFATLGWARLVGLTMPEDLTSKT